jgi:hypothetical protein
MAALRLASALIGLALAAPALAADPETDIATMQAERGKEIVCRKEKETGSLVKTKKTCHSRQQWAYIDDTNQQFTRTMADDMRTKQRGN